jgi:hypothetical protein
MKNNNAKVEELRERMAQQKAEVEALQEFWLSTFPEFEIPDVRQCQVWLKLYDFDTAWQSIEATNLRMARRQDANPDAEVPYSKPMGRGDVIRYASGVMKGMKLLAEREREAEEREAQETREEAGGGE